MDNFYEENFLVTIELILYSYSYYSLKSLQYYLSSPIIIVVIPIIMFYFISYSIFLMVILLFYVLLSYFYWTKYIKAVLTNRFIDLRRDIGL